jgi:outer membrane protein TolC
MIRFTVPILVLLAGSIPAASLAQPLARVGFDEALDLGDRSPVVEGSRRALAARRRGDEGIGGTAQATQITVMPGATIAPDQAQGFELQVNVTQGWNLGDLGGARRAAAARERDALSGRVRARALRARLEAARRWVELRTLEELETSLEAQARVLDREVALTTRAVEAGVSTGADLAEIRALAAALSDQRLRVEGERFSASVRLATAMGWSEDGAGALLTDGPAPQPRLPSFDEMRVRIASVDGLPEVAARRLAETAARAREVEAGTQYAPVLQLGGQLERTSVNAWVVYGVAGLSFSAFGQERRSVALARADTERAISETELARVEARAELMEALHEVAHTRRQESSLREGLLPALETLASRRARALELGEGTIFASMEARRRVLEARASLERARGARVWAEVRLWLLLAELAQGEEEAS